MYDVILKRFDMPDEVRTFEKGKFELVHIGGMTGRVNPEPALYLNPFNGREPLRREQVTSGN